MKINLAIKRFLKPDRRKMIVFSLIILLFVNGFLKLVSLPSQYVFLNKYIFAHENGINLIQYPMVFLFFVVFGFTPDTPEIPFSAVLMCFILSILLALFFWYIIVCLIFFINDCFNSFGKKAGKYKIIAIVIIIFIYTGYTMIIQEAQDSVSVETWIPSEVVAEEVYGCRHSPIQVITLKNDFPVKVDYQLPEVYTCLYDIQGRVMERVPSTYMVDREYVPSSNRISLVPFSETKIYLKVQVRGCNYMEKDITELLDKYSQYDEILFLWTQNKSIMAPCINWSEEEIRNAERVKILK